MKKLIAILSSSLIMASSAVLAVSCTTKEVIVESEFLNSKNNLTGSFKYQAANLIANDQYHINSTVLNKGFQTWNATGYSSIDGFDDKDKGLSSMSLPEIVNKYLGDKVSVNKVSGNIDLNGTYGTGTGNFIDQGIMNLIVDILKGLIGDPNSTQSSGFLESIFPIETLTKSGLVDPMIPKLMMNKIKEVLLTSLDKFKEIDFGKVLTTLTKAENKNHNQELEQSLTANPEITWPEGLEDNLWDGDSGYRALIQNFLAPIGFLDETYMKTYDELKNYSILSLFNDINMMIGQKKYINFSEASDHALFKENNTYERILNSTSTITNLLGINLLNEIKVDKNKLLSDDEYQTQLKTITDDASKNLAKMKILDKVDSPVDKINDDISLSEIIPVISIVFSLLNNVKYINNFSNLTNNNPKNLWTSEQIEAGKNTPTISKPEDFYYAFPSILQHITQTDIDNLTSDTPSYDGLIKNILLPILNDVVKFVPNLAYYVINDDASSETIRLQNLFNIYNSNEWTSQDNSYAFDRLGIYDESTYSDFKIKTPIAVKILTGIVGEAARLVPNLNGIPDSIKEIITNMVIPGVKTDKLINILPATLESIITNILYCLTNNKTFKMAEGQKTGSTVVQENDGLILKLKTDELPDADNKNVQSLLNSALVSIANDGQINSILNTPLSYVAKALTDAIGTALKPLFDLKKILFETHLKDIFGNKNDPFFDGIGSKYAYDSKYKDFTIIDFLTYGYIDGTTNLLPFILDKALDIISDLNTKTNPLDINDALIDITSNMKITSTSFNNFKQSNIIENVVYQVNFEMDDAIFYTKNQNEIAQYAGKKSGNYNFVLKRTGKYDSFTIDSMTKL